MKKKIILLIFICFFLIAKLFGPDASASMYLSEQAKLNGSYVQKIEEMKSLDGESGQKSEEVKSEGEASGQEGEKTNPGQEGEETNPGQDSEGTNPGQNSEGTNPGQEGEETKPGQEDDETKLEKSPYRTRLSLGLLLYQGDMTFVGIRYDKKAVHTVVSSDPSVVKVSKQGKINALKCGRADVTAVLENGGQRDELVLHVRVKASSYAKTHSHGKAAAKVARPSQAGLMAYRELAPGKALRLKAGTGSGGMKITYDSTDDSVAKVNGQGTVTAEKKGTCTIRAVLQNGGKKAVYRIKLFVKDPQKLTVTNEQKDAYFNGSVMVGNSLGVGLERYCSQQYAGFLGNERHFSSGSFSLMNDMRPISATSLHPTYNGRKYRVKDALKVMGAEKAFLSFGMNDLNIYGVVGTADVYQQFIKELQKDNKGLKVYVVSLTPVRRTSGRLENGSIREFNGLMEAYAQKTKDVYFTDIFTAFLDGAGLLASQYCSDGFCHLTNAGYEVWTDQLKQFAGQQIAKEIKAKDAVTTVKQSHLKQDYKTAKKIVEKLERGALQTKYRKQLKTLKGKLHS